MRQRIGKLRIMTITFTIMSLVIVTGIVVTHAEKTDVSKVIFYVG